MLALTFLNPFLLWGAGLASIPLIIHILNRRRFKKVRWAAMEFLLKAFKENRRRMRFEQLLLLLLRMAAVALLAFLLSRPSASSEDFGPWRKSVHHVFLLDESGSLGERLESGVAFDRAKRRILGRLESLAKRSGASTDRFTVIRSASTKAELEAKAVTMASVGQLRDALQSMRVTPSRFAPTAAFRRLMKIRNDLGDAVDSTNLYVVSDLRRSDWIGAEGRLRSEILQAVRPLNADKIFVEPVAGEARDNLAIRSMQPRVARAIKNVPLEIEVVIENQGAGASEAGEIGLSIDGEARKTRPLPSLAPGERKSLIFRPTLTRSGGHWLEADLPGDRFPIDDRRALAVQVVDSARLLLVDGDPGDREELQETFYLAIAFDPAGDASASFDVTRVDDTEVSERDFAEYDLIALANVAQLDAETAERLGTWVSKGGGLIAFVGDQVEATLWNKSLWRGGEGALPAPLLEVSGDPDEPRPLVIADKEHELWRGKDSAEALAGVMQVADVGRWFSIGSEQDSLREAQLPEGTRALLRVGDEAGPPLFVERNFGEGRVGLFLTTADAAWTSWASNPSYLVVMRLAAEMFMRRQELERINVDAFGAVNDEFDAANYQTDVTMTPARVSDDASFAERGFTLRTGKSAEALVLDAAPEDWRPWPAAGAYRLGLRRGDGKDEARFFAVQAWEDEGRTATVDKQAFLSALPPELRDRTTYVEAEGQDLDDGNEFWRMLAFVLLGMLFVETLLAWRVGRN